MKIKRFVFVVVLLGIAVLSFNFIPFKKEQTQHITQVKQTNDSIPDSLLTLIAVGDIMMGSNYPNETYLPPNDQHLLAPLHSFLQKGDITFGNLEGTVLNSGGEIKKCGDPSKCYAFRQPEYVVDQLKTAGFNMLSIANNHMGDFGETGRKNTQRVLKEKGFCYAGLDSCPWDTMTVKSVKIGFTAFAPNTACLQITDYVRAQQIVKELDKMCDVVIVSFHGGAEGSSKTHITKQTEIFYGENRGNVYEFARKVIDAGADVVLGHGPHVTRAIDQYKGRFITYSMGNFCTYGQFNLKGISGMAPMFELKLSKNGTFVSGRVISTMQEGRGLPKIDPLNGAYEQVKLLTKQDLPELKVEFLENGYFKF